MRRAVYGLAGMALLGLAGFWALTAPRLPSLAGYAGLTGDSAAGETVFWAAGCASCHAAAEARGEALLVLSGGQRFVTAFGTFLAPNISPDPEAGIGGWTLEEFAGAITAGVSPAGEHLYPALPYAAYARMAPQEVADLKAFMDALPASSTSS